MVLYYVTVYIGPLIIRKKRPMAIVTTCQGRLSKYSIQLNPLAQRTESRSSESCSPVNAPDNWKLSVIVYCIALRPHPSQLLHIGYSVFFTWYAQ